MSLDRRRLLALSGATAAFARALTLPAAARAAPQTTSAFGLDATQLGVRAGSSEDQSAALQRAIDQAARARAPLALPPGTYRAGNLTLPDGAQLVGTRGATRLVFSGGPSLLSAQGADHVGIAGLVLDGGKRPLPERRGLVHCESGRGLKIIDCEIVAAGGHGLLLSAMAGEILDTTIAQAADVALLSYDARGLTIARNEITDAGNNGIQILRQAEGRDGTIVVDNRVERIDNRAGGSGQYGNAINAHRAGNVIVRGNQIRGCAFSAVRGNSASDIEILGNSVSEVGEVALYSEFSFEGAVIAHNTVDGATTGISIANFNDGGRLAVVQGNIIRNLTRRRSDIPEEESGYGIYVEADTAVSGNVVENAANAGFVLGWGPYLRDVAVTGNVVRRAAIGVAVSVVPGAGSALIADNLISGATRGAVVGMDHAKPVTGDLLRDGAERYAHLSLSGNRAG
jgi:uncharacterized secreted repeat protein (TIGR03808 family)